MLDINDNNWIERIPCSVRDILVARQLLTKYTKHCLKKPIVIPLSRKIFKKPRHRPDSMCQLPPKKPNIEEKKPKSQTIFWRQLPLIKAKFVKFGFKKANLATLPSYCCQQSAFFVTVAVTRGAFSLRCWKSKAFCERPFALHRQQSEKDKHCRRCPPWKNLCGHPCSRGLQSGSVYNQE